MNYIEDYPYPFVVNRLCWELPCVTPSDWQAQFLHGPNNPATVRDWKAEFEVDLAGSHAVREPVLRLVRIGSLIGTADR